MSCQSLLLAVGVTYKIFGLPPPGEGKNQIVPNWPLLSCSPIHNLQSVSPKSDGMSPYLRFRIQAGFRERNEQHTIPTPLMGNCQFLRAPNQIRIPPNNGGTFGWRLVPPTRFSATPTENIGAGRRTRQTAQRAGEPSAENRCSVPPTRFELVYRA